MEPRVYLEDFFGKIAKNEDKMGGVNVKIQYDFSGDDHGKWYVEIVDGKVMGVVEGEIENPSCTFIAKYKNFHNAFTGKAKPAAAFMTGKIKLKGDKGIAIKLEKWSR